MAGFQNSLFGRTLTEPSQATTEEILLLYSQGWHNSGRWTSDGECWTHSMPEFLNGVIESSLSQILEENVSEKYFLSPRACRGILHRAEKAGVNVPELLRQTLEEQSREAS